MNLKTTLVIITRGLLVFSTAGGLAFGARAAVYNLYFNNAEQGDNSTSTPSVIVKDGKDKGSNDDESTEVESAPTETKATEEKPAPKEESAPSRPTSPSEPSRLADYSWRVGISIGGYSNRDSNSVSTYSGTTDSYDYYSSARNGTYATVSLGYFPVQKFGLNVYAQLGIPEDSSRHYSSYSGYSTTSRDTRNALGAELEFNPLRFMAGQGHEALELGVTLGVSSLMHDEAGWLDLAHVGIRGAYNFSSGWGLMAIWRVSPKYQSVDLGVNFLF